MKGDKTPHTEAQGAKIVQATQEYYASKLFNRQDFNNIPNELTQLNNFVLWMLSPKEGKTKPDKIPFNPKNRRQASATNPATWGSFTQSCQAYDRHKAEVWTFQTKEGQRQGTVCGIGVVLTTDLGLVAIDLDNCILQDGSLEAWAKDFVETLNSYTEISPSGRGLRVFVYGRLPKDGMRKDSIEAYANGRYVTVTGDIFGTTKPIEHRQDEINTLVEKYLTTPTSQAVKTPARPIELDDKQLLDIAFRASNGVEIKALYDGDHSQYTSQSDADLALVSHLAFYTQCNEAQIDAIFRSSGLMRTKWDELRGQQTYGAMTIAKAVSNCKTVYDPKREQYNANRVYDEQLGAYVNTAVEVPPQPKTWEAITLFDGLDLPSLDPAFLPDEYREYCACISQELQVPIELVIAIFFSMVGTAVQGKFAVLVKKNYIEELCLFWMPLLNPSERKSATLSRLKSPVQQWERTKAEAMKDEIVRRNSERQTLQMAIDDRRKKAARAKNTEERQKYMAEIAQFEEDMPEALYAPLLFLDDATAESIVYALSIHGSVTFAEAEGKLMDILAGLYGKSHNFDVFLKGYGAETIRTHRRNAAPIFVPSPRITMCLAVQLFIIQNRAAGQAFRNKGLDSRLNFFAPKSKVGFRDLEPQATPDHVEEKYRALLHRLLDIDMPENPHLLTLSPEAYDVYMTFARHVEESLSPQGTYADMPDWQGKAVGKAIRIAGLIHCMEHLDPKQIPIQPHTMENACYLVEILGAHARAVYGLMDESEQITIAKKALKWITDNKRKSFQARECHQGIKGTFPTMEQVQKGLDELEERNFIRLVPQKQARGKGKPPSPTYEVNPTLYGVKS